MRDTRSKTSVRMGGNSRQISRGYERGRVAWDHRLNGLGSVVLLDSKNESGLVPFSIQETFNSAIMNTTLGHTRIDRVLLPLA